MIFETYTPSFPLNNFIDTMIYYEGVAQSHTVDRFLPNGDTEILIDFHDRPQFIYDNKSLKEIQACNHVWTSGIRTQPITIPSGNDSAMMVITFKKGMAASFFPFPMDEISDCVVDADLIWGSDFGALREKLLDIKIIERRFLMVEQFLLSKFSSNLELNPCIAFAVKEITERPDQISVAKMNSKIGFSQKHFVQLFRKHVGVTPKSYVRLMRFQRAIQTIDSAATIDWVEVAYDCGFYDQSHFINDFKHFAGFTPEVYAKIQRNYQNYVPVG